MQGPGGKKCWTGHIMAKGSVQSDSGAETKMHSKLGVVHIMLSPLLDIWTQEVSLAYELTKLPEQWNGLFCLNIKTNEALEDMQQEGEI